MANIYEVLKADHDRQRALLKRVGDHPGTDGPRREAFETLRLDLQAHAAAEEESLYATMLGDPDLREDARHSVSEHKEVDDYLGELLDLEFGSSDWDDKFAEMRHRYEHHIDEEEEEMFPTADEHLSAEVEEALGEKFEERKPAELERAEEHKPGDERE
ncbi:hemerythrin domain-containing protein [Sphingomonas xinjiangensis]|uniref:Hemerythrin-like domain-containing protein n=1 Tax=Sphingomonas xinjiangensis TaxID=643568 RepID=A0A840YGY1_9SPHN|nr:hemerythrin domain-containing protein [Sphingomonas xinjiangensis]MBB5711249.1 hemerythrin-like domain-containing protein [Sphingomonas xinjiangensis]